MHFHDCWKEGNTSSCFCEAPCFCCVLTPKGTPRGFWPAPPKKVRPIPAAPLGSLRQIEAQGGELDAKELAKGMLKLGIAAPRMRWLRCGGLLEVAGGPRKANRISPPNLYLIFWLNTEQNQRAIHVWSNFLGMTRPWLKSKKGIPDPTASEHVRFPTPSNPGGERRSDARLSGLHRALDSSLSDQELPQSSC